MAKGFLLDTQVLYWLGEDLGSIGRVTTKILERQDLYFSSVSVAELSFKMRFGKFKFDLSILELWQSEGILPLNFNIEAGTAFSRFSPEWVPDPFDRQIMAVAAANNLGLITSDRRILSQNFDWILDATK